MSNFTTIDQETVSRIINGVDYGAVGKVLARTQDKLLVWFGGSSGKGGGYGSVWSPATLRVIGRKDHGGNSLSKKICEGERFHQRVFEKYGEKIDKHFGEGFWRLLELRQTVVVGDSLPFGPRGEMAVTGREFGYDLVMRQKAKRDELIAQGVTGIELEMRSLSEA
jgi:hypothetical protein